MSAKDFKKGTESFAGAHYVFMRKQGEATSELSKRIIKKIDEFGNIIEIVIDSLNEQELKNIFGIYSSLNIGTLDHSDQIKLLAYLKTLSVRRGQTTPQQKEYFFAVKKYLNIASVSDTFAFESVSELDISRSSLKAFLECVCEFLFLKNGSRAFVKEFKLELDYFGLNDKIINELIESIEKTYHYFGVQGIIEHYSLEPITEKGDVTNEPITIPFFEKPIVVIYDEKDKHNAIYAEMLQSTIHEYLKSIGAKEAKAVSITTQKDSISKKQLYEDSRHIIYIGVPQQAQSLASIIKWEFDKFGIRYGTSGEKSIISVSKLRKKDYQSFVDYVKQNASRWADKTTQTVSCLNSNFLKKAFSGNDWLVNILATAVAWPILIAGGIVDIADHTLQQGELYQLQFFVAIDSFLLSKTKPYYENMV